MRTILIAEIRRRLRASWRERGAAPAELGWVDEVFDPGVLKDVRIRCVNDNKQMVVLAI